jgi:hypothetical protein
LVVYIADPSRAAALLPDEVDCTGEGDGVG